ncbi:MAG: SAM-dependent methyltransferase [Elusimicrobia bacterium]|nr:SAM-dependent methyltransferase [Elusimicrobiota bacterium]
MKLLLLASYGLRPEQITLETLSQLAKADVVLCAALDRHGAGRLSRYCGNLVFLDDPGVAFTRDMPIPEMARRTMALFDRHARVGFLTYGHPGFLCGIADELIRLCERRGVRWRVLDAVSSLNAALNAVGVRGLGSRGVLLLSACTTNDVRAILPDRHILVFDVFQLARPEGGSIRKLWAAEIAASYPSDHALALVECAWRGGADRIIRTTPAKLERNLAAAGEASTLYIPPLPAGAWKRTPLRASLPRGPRRR